jgi:hypothetical protein
MMRFRNRSAAAAAALLLALAGCGGDATGASRPGELRFTFEGAASGSFEAAGHLDPADVRAGSWAVASVDSLDAEPILSVVAQRQRPGARDLVVIGVVDPTVGVRECGGEAEECAVDALFVAGITAAGDDDAVFYAARAGSVTLTRFGGGRAAGSFVIDLVDDDGPAPRAIRATGTFDVPILTTVPALRSVSPR